MTHPEVQWVLDAIADNWNSVGTATVGDATVGESIADVPLERVDRDNSEILERPPRDKVGDLQKSNYVGATLAGRDTTPIGTEYDHDTEAVVGVRVEGLAASEYGHIDPDGKDGIAWSTLLRKLFVAILLDRGYPSVDRHNTQYTHLRIANRAPQSDDYDDYYRYDFDVVFSGYEELP